MHFLQMPIEDEFLSQLVPDQPPGVLMTDNGPAMDPSEQPIPFADVGNPIMAQVNSPYSHAELPYDGIGPANAHRRQQLVVDSVKIIKWCWRALRECAGCLPGIHGQPQGGSCSSTEGTGGAW